MEEHVGLLWHRWISRAASTRYPEAAVSLQAIAPRLGMLYRAFGGDPGLKLGGAAEVAHGSRLGWLQKIAGTGQKAALASIEPGALRLPAQLDCFPEQQLNADLYLWLTALAGCDTAPTAQWLWRNQQATLAAFARFPGLQPLYQRLLAAHLALRPDPAKLPDDEAAQEHAIRTALSTPGSVPDLPPSHTGKPPKHAPAPVWLWLSPLAGAFHPEVTSGESSTNDTSAPSAAEPDNSDNPRALKSERVDLPTPKSPIILPFRAEGLPTWGEYLRVNRALDDDPDPDAKRTAEDMDQLSLARGGPPTRSKVRFDLDLPSPAADDLYLGDGLPLPEWDYRHQAMQEGYCRLQPMLASEAEACELPEALLPAARQLRQRFAALLANRRWQPAQPDGEEIDLDACVRLRAELCAGTVPDSGLYRARLPRERDLACLLLADLSLSTDAWVSNTHRVVDVIREALFLFCEALSATGDRFGVYGFSSVKRSHVRFHLLKDFASRYDALARGRINAIKPGYYTRMGAALRQATRILAEQPGHRRLLLLLSDGKPNDLDQYDSRYGVEDTRQAVIEAKQAGMIPFCVTIDQEGGDYLPYLFGPKGYAIVRHPDELPLRLPQLYARISRNS